MILENIFLFIAQQS